MTVARLGRENLRYRIVAAVIETLPIDSKEHEKYNPSWPIIKGRLPIPGEEMISVWPCNHLGFSYGDLTPVLAEIAHRLDIGYTIYDREGNRYFKPS